MRGNYRRYSEEDCNKPFPGPKPKAERQTKKPLKPVVKSGENVIDTREKP